VLNLTDLVLTNKSILTLNGSASDNFVINVSRNFSLTSQSKIVLSGDLGWDDVLFNIKGTENNVTLDGQSSMSGILMANKRTVSIAGASIVNGEVIANKIKLSGSSQIVHPPVTSP
jgi:choice-of-anchor A domain-containing protein